MMTAVRAQVAAMVHPSALPDSLERMRHERFMLARLAIGAGGLSLVPAYIAWRGRLDLFETLVLIALGLPLLAVVLLSRTGRLDLAHCVSGAALTLFIIALACMTGGTGSPLLLWLAAVPAEAMFFGSRAYVARGSALAVVGLGAVVALQSAGAVGEPAAWAVAAMPVLVASAILCAMLLAVSFLRRHEDELREHRASDARARLMLEHVGDLVTWHDPSGAVVFANEAACLLTGAQSAQLHGKGLFERVHIADRPLFLKALSDAAHGAGHASACFRVLFLADSAGVPTVRWLELNARRIDQAGARNGAAVVCVARDVTDRHARDEERERNHAAAVKASDLKGHFLATVSHELRTPLNAIIGFSEMIERQVLGENGWPRYIEYSRHIHRSGTHLLALINDVLDLSKIEAGRYELTDEVIALSELLDACQTMVMGRAEAEGLQVVVSLPETGLSLRGDRRALTQIVLNLLTNAVKYNAQGGSVAVAASRRADGAVDLSIRDSGPGIAPGEIDRLFQPFQRTDAALARSVEGTGLGLSITKRLVELHDGEIHLASRLGEGTTVTVTWPSGRVVVSETGLPDLTCGP